MFYFIDMKKSLAKCMWSTVVLAAFGADCTYLRYKFSKNVKNIEEFLETEFSENTEKNLNCLGLYEKISLYF